MAHPIMSAPSTDTLSTAPAAVPVMGPAEYGFILLRSMLWGSTFFFVALIGDAMPPITMSVVRLIPAVAILLVVVAAFGLRHPASRRDWALFLLLAALNNVVPFLLITYAQREVTGGIAAVFNATAPLFALVFAALLLPSEPLSWRRAGGIVLGITGVAVLIGASTATSSLSAKLMLLAAASCYAIANVVTRLFFSTIYPPFVVASAQMSASLVLATVLMLLAERPWTLPAPGAATVALVMVMGVLGSAFASLCHFTVLKRAGATNALLVTIILPLTPILLGAIFLGDRFTLREGLGAAIIASALVVIDGRVFGRRSSVKAR
jgi:drug/metabolite transporter (DMT)-like permease